MRPWPQVEVIAVLAVALLTPARAQEPPAETRTVLLAPRFTPGEQVRYRMTLVVETRSHLEPIGTSATNADPLRVSFDIGWVLEAVEAAPDGSASLRATIEALQIESSSPSPEPPATRGFVGKSVSYRVAGDGRIENIQAPPEWLEQGKPPAWLRSWLEQGSETTGEVPRRPIQIGESWQDERDIEVAGLPRQRLRAVSTYARDTDVGGVLCASVVTRLELAGAESREERNPDGAVLTMDSRAQGSGSRLSCYDLSNGRLLESTQTTEQTFRVGIRRGTEKAGGARLMLLDTLTKIKTHVRVVY
ncbi:MAG: hypothetical protein L0212_11860 [Acidobacteria bacterium]|nr:hypothetical protein [Acidobacteriota bacterium]